MAQLSVILFIAGFLAMQVSAESEANNTIPDEKLTKEITTNNARPSTPAATTSFVPVIARRQRQMTTRPAPVDLTKKRGKDRSTSSSEGDPKKDGKSGEGTHESLDISDSESSSASEDKKKRNKYRQRSTEERHGWRKWHRKCTRCPAEEALKWRDPRVKWICGAYQRARRSFKSPCMMYRRNCQDGTMFVMIHPNKCQNENRYDSHPHGEHFFYDYRAKLSDDSSKSGEYDDSEGGGSSSSESSSDTSDA